MISKRFQLRNIIWVTLYLTGDFLENVSPTPAHSTGITLTQSEDNYVIIPDILLEQLKNFRLATVSPTTIFSGEYLDSRCVIAVENVLRLSQPEARCWEERADSCPGVRGGLGHNRCVVWRHHTSDPET